MQRIKENWWWAIPFAIALFGFLTAFLVLLNGDISSAPWDAKGFEYFLKYFDFPLKVLAASILVLTICLSIHRLSRIEKQIRISEANAFVGNYLELAKSYQSQFKLIKLDLARNMNYLFPGKPMATFPFKKE